MKFVIQNRKYKQLQSCDGHTFQYSASEGAVLALPTGATIYEAVNARHFETHAARHGASWYEYVLKEGFKCSSTKMTRMQFKRETVL